MGKYEIPELNKTSFTCEQCQTYSKHNWEKYKINGSYERKEIVSYYADDSMNLLFCTCEACGNFSLWLDEKQIYPLASNIVAPNEDMPKEVKVLYNEARDVYKISPKSSAALLRLAIQVLCKELGEPGKNINTDIGNLVQKGLDPSVQQMLDSIRIIGNEAVHPGEIKIDENPELVAILFYFINHIVYSKYTKQKEIDEIYSMLPQEKLDAIEARDSQKKS